MPSSRLVLRVWPAMLAALYAVFIVARPPLLLFGRDTAWLSVAVFAVGSVAAALTAALPNHRTWFLPAVMAPPLFRSLTIGLGAATTTLPTGQVVGFAAYLTIFTAIVCIHLLSVPMAADNK